jgi:ABC-type dipeptide/oligopeptide/nickel transport system permease component
VTVIGIGVALVIGGAVVTESLFAIPILTSLGLSAARAKDVIASNTAAAAILVGLIIGVHPKCVADAVPPLGSDNSSLSENHQDKTATGYRSSLWL